LEYLEILNSSSQNVQCDDTKVLTHTCSDHGTFGYFKITSGKYLFHTLPPSWQLSVVSTMYGTGSMPIISGRQQENVVYTTTISNGG